MKEQQCCIHIDCDTLKCLYRCYHITHNCPEFAFFFEAFENLFAALNDWQIPVTLFIIAEDLRDKKKVHFLKKLSGQAKFPIEWASHSYSHPYNLTRLDKTKLQHEIADSRKMIEDIFQAPVAGFKAPAYNVNKQVLDQVEAAGYTYDASYWNSWGSMAMKLISGGFKSGQYGPFFSALSPSKPWKIGEALIELPLSGAGKLLKLPAHSSFVLAFGDRYWRMIRPRLLKMDFLCYSFHLIDFASVQEAKLRKLPGYQLSYPIKRVQLDKIVQTLKKAFIMETSVKSIGGVSL